MDNVIVVSASRGYGDFTLAITNDGNLWAWGKINKGD